MVGLLLVAVIGIAVLVDLWALLDIRRGLDMVIDIYYIGKKKVRHKY